ncbi:hypothetical protein [Sphingomonas colocasiae]|uniref:Uncharacterized protein n=1 Tax=Sphingomonas colocasiae TaxID=1848973 RepID=A0ABS7PUT4_9SPHN|nr:hypothetical protein [Sphingomonas colocasiae]MBY8825112.1 hypothetical protein [Sphingomonas colocasiae]
MRKAITAAACLLALPGVACAESVPIEETNGFTLSKRMLIDKASKLAWTQLTRLARDGNTASYEQLRTQFLWLKIGVEFNACRAFASEAEKTAWLDRLETLDVDSPDVTDATRKYLRDLALSAFKDTNISDSPEPETDWNPCDYIVPAGRAILAELPNLADPPTRFQLHWTVDEAKTVMIESAKSSVRAIIRDNRKDPRMSHLEIPEKYGWMLWAQLGFTYNICKAFAIRPEMEQWVSKLLVFTKDEDPFMQMIKPRLRQLGKKFLQDPIPASFTSLDEPERAAYCETQLAAAKELIVQMK